MISLSKLYKQIVEGQWAADTRSATKAKKDSSLITNSRDQGQASGQDILVWGSDSQAEDNPLEEKTWPSDGDKTFPKEQDLEDALSYLNHDDEKEIRPKYHNVTNEPGENTNLH